MDISVGILTHNRSKLLGRAIDSLLASTVEGFSFEIIVIDNASCDDTCKVMDDYSEYHNIKYLRREINDIGAARNEFIKCSKGELICFVDDDDYVEQDMLQYLYELYRKYHADITICNAYVVKENEEGGGSAVPKFLSYDTERIFNTAEGLEHLLERNYYNSGNACKLIKKDVAINILYKEGKQFDDIHTIYRIFAEAKKIVLGRECKYYCIKHESNNSAAIYKLNAEQLDEYMSAFNERTSYLSKRIPELKGYFLYTELSYVLSMLYKAEKEGIADIDKQKVAMRKMIKTSYDFFMNCRYTKDFEKQRLQEIMDCKERERI